MYPAIAITMRDLAACIKSAIEKETSFIKMSLNFTCFLCANLFRMCKIISVAGNKGARGQSVPQVPSSRQVLCKSSSKNVKVVPYTFVRRGVLVRQDIYPEPSAHEVGRPVPFLATFISAMLPLGSHSLLGEQ